jgi:hypothetical protein
MDEIRKAVVDAVVSLIGSIGEQSEMLVVGAFALAGAWLKAQWSAGAQREAAFNGALAAEKWAAEEVAAGRRKPTGPEKKRHAISKGHAALPVLHKPVLPGVLGRKIESAMPAVRRVSAPPPEPEPPKPDPAAN